MEAALISPNRFNLSETLEVRGCVYFNKYISLRRGELVNVSLSEKQFKFIVGTFAQQVSEAQKGDMIVQAFSEKKRVSFVKGEIRIQDKDKEIGLTREEFDDLCERKSEVEEIFAKFLIYSPVTPISTDGDVNGQQQQPNFGLMNALANNAPAVAVADGGAVMVNAVGLGPEFSFVYQRFVNEQGNANPSCRRRLANRMCDVELHELVLAALVKGHLEDKDERKRNCNGCKIDHGSQKQHMSPGCMDPDEDIIEEWLSRAANKTYFKNNVTILGQRHLKAPIPDRADDVNLVNVAKMARGTFTSLCVPGRITLPLYRELLQYVGLNI